MFAGFGFVEDGFFTFDVGNEFAFVKAAFEHAFGTVGVEGVF